MSFDFSEYKSLCRRVVHNTLAVPAFYSAEGFAMPVEITIRWHNKIEKFAEMSDAGYAETIDGVNRIIFFTPELAQKGVTPSVGAEITLADARWGGATLVLVNKEPQVGPHEEIWTVAHK